MMAADDWKGEHFIRIRRRTEVKTRMKRCADPECDTALDKENHIGVCKWHIHGDFCLCRMCRKKRRQLS